MPCSPFRTTHQISWPSSTMSSTSRPERAKKCRRVCAENRTRGACGTNNAAARWDASCRGRRWTRRRPPTGRSESTKGRFDVKEMFQDMPHDDDVVVSFTSHVPVGFDVARDNVESFDLAKVALRAWRRLNGGTREVGCRSGAGAGCFRAQPRRSGPWLVHRKGVEQAGPRPSHRRGGWQHRLAPPCIPLRRIAHSRPHIHRRPCAERGRRSPSCVQRTALR